MGADTEETNWVFGVSNRIFPADKRGRILFFLSLLFAGYLYLARLVLTDFFVGTLGAYLVFFFWISPVFWLAGLLFHIVFLSIYIFKLHGSPSSALFLVVGLLLARFLPIPSTPEEILFSWQRADYNQIVELARNNQLQHDGNCLTKNDFQPPSSYFQWSTECIYVYQQDGIVVEFAPRTLERPIIFLENPTSNEFPPCWHDRDNRVFESRMFKQLSEHWFICERLIW